MQQGWYLQVSEAELALILRVSSLPSSCILALAAFARCKYQIEGDEPYLVETSHEHVGHLPLLLKEDEIERASVEMGCKRMPGSGTDMRELQESSGKSGV